MQVGLAFRVRARLGGIARHGAKGSEGRARRFATLAAWNARDLNRDSDRLQMPEPMRHDVRLLGNLLGEVLREAGGRNCSMTWNGCGTR